VGERGQEPLAALLLSACATFFFGWLGLLGQVGEPPYSFIGCERVTEEGTLPEDHLIVAGGCLDGYPTGIAAGGEQSLVSGSRCVGIDQLSDRALHPVTAEEDVGGGGAAIGELDMHTGAGVGGGHQPFAVLKRDTAGPHQLLQCLVDVGAG